MAQAQKVTRYRIEGESRFHKSTVSIYARSMDSQLTKQPLHCCVDRRIQSLANDITRSGPELCRIWEPKDRSCRDLSLPFANKVFAECPQRSLEDSIAWSRVRKGAEPGDCGFSSCVESAHQKHWFKVIVLVWKGPLLTICFWAHSDWDPGNGCSKCVGARRGPCRTHVQIHFTIDCNCQQTPTQRTQRQASSPNAIH